MATEVYIKGETKKLDSREDVADIVRQIDECEGLTTLQLSGNSFGVEATRAIGESLAKKPHFTRALWSDMFVSRLKSEIPPALTALGEGIMNAHSCLTELDLSDNAFGPTGVEPILSLLTSPSFYSIKILKFNNNGLGVKGGKYLSKALLQCHEEAQKAGEKLALEVFVAGRNRLEDEGATALSEVFEAIRSLVQVSMPQNGINSDGICALANAFSNNPNLEVIDLNDNTFTEVGSKSMADILPSIQKLRVINFGDCLVRSEGAQAISEAIKDSHNQLEEINLGYNELELEAGLALVAALANKKMLKKIELNGNCFGEEGIELLRESLEAKGHLEALGTLSDDEGLEEEDNKEEREEEEEREEKENKEDEEEEEKEQERKDNETDKDEEKSTAETQRVITFSDYLHHPSGENLVALGENRIKIILDSLSRNSPGNQNEADLEKKLLWVADTAAMFIKVARDYNPSVEQPDNTQSVIENTIGQGYTHNHTSVLIVIPDSYIDAIIQPLSQSGLVSELINHILIHIGLLKSEDKSFVPVKEVEGPVLALKYIALQDYFPRLCADILIAFFTKSNAILAPLLNKGIINQLLQVLHAL